jgi:dTDP-4-amino-4,6-dideoxygalactose transaminase
VARTVVAAGFTPVFLDADPETYGLNLYDLKQKASELAALVLVHSFGYPAPIEEVFQLMDGKPIIEDCAQALWSSYRGRPLGSFGEAAIFSFGFFKPLSVGGGGCVVTKSNALSQRLELALSSTPRENSVQVLSHAAHHLLYAFAFRRLPYTAISVIRRGCGEDIREETARNGTGELISTHLGIRSSDIRLAMHKLRARNPFGCACEEFWTAIRERLPAQLSTPPEPRDAIWNHFQLPIQARTPDDCDRALRGLWNAGVGAARLYPNCMFENRASGYLGNCYEAERLAKSVFMLPGHARLTASERQKVLGAIAELAR